MIRWNHLFGIGLAAVFSLSAWANMVAPDVLARNTTNEVLRIVKQDKDIKNGNSKKILDLVEQKILPNFDFRKMTQLAVARNWSKATPEQQDALVSQFKTMLVRTYSASISSVADYKIEFKPLRIAVDSVDVTVNTEVSKPGARRFRSTIAWKNRTTAGRSMTCWSTTSAWSPSIATRSTPKSAVAVLRVW